MEKIENLNVYFNGDKVPEKPVEIILREGDAPEPLKTVNPVKQVIEGDIDTVLTYVKGRYNPSEEEGKPVEKGVIILYCDDPDHVAIKLLIDEKNPLATVVKGSLEKNPDLRNFQFNEGAAFDNKSFIKTIKKNAHCFNSLMEAQNLIKQLSSFQATFETKVEDLDDRRGNTSLGVKTVLDSSKTGIPETLSFNMPLFNGGPKVSFIVEVELDVVNEGNRPQAKFGFVSMEIVQLARDHAEEIIKNQIGELSKYFTCIRTTKVD